MTRKQSANGANNDTSGNTGDNDSTDGATDSAALTEDGFNLWRTDVSEKLNRIFDHLFPENDGSADTLESDMSDGDTGTNGGTSDGSTESPKTLSFWERNKRYFIS